VEAVNEEADFWSDRLSELGHSWNVIHERIGLAVSQSFRTNKLKPKAHAIVLKDLGKRLESLNVKLKIGIKRPLVGARHDPSHASGQSDCCGELNALRKLLYLGIGRSNLLSKVDREPKSCRSQICFGEETFDHVNSALLNGLRAQF
jgi:hypothetical protein